ncbi:hypothetical protein [Gordonia sp. NB41Y]|uniref:hypothetical protein n=1 Tax=Gordonia sp. NB41Y TaxID=875808 RepID=UPI0002BE3DF1|nr:hypothetical protein [Gordonia sp. NB41Y]EMP14481.1 hypothetical protein ISGA_3 [Gordonia sp. NB41Y]WLP92571.1 hypothetical protein Q9K23_10250 [Gordonia sp. NB41Y]
MSTDGANTHADNSSHTGSTVIYWIVGAVVLVLLVVMLATYDYHRDNKEAVAKAEQLISLYQQNGLATPYPAQKVAQVLGDDGGTVCAATGSKEQLGYLKTQIGVGGEFYVRPIILTENVFEGMRLIVEVYCPQNAAVVREFIDEQNYAR